MDTIRPTRGILSTGNEIENFRMDGAGANSKGPGRNLRPSLSHRKAPLRHFVPLDVSFPHFRAGAVYGLSMAAGGEQSQPMLIPFTIPFRRLTAIYNIFMEMAETIENKGFHLLLFTAFSL